MKIKPGINHGDLSPQYKWCVVCRRWIYPFDIMGGVGDATPNPDLWSKHEAIHAPIKAPSVTR